MQEPSLMSHVRYYNFKSLSSFAFVGGYIKGWGNPFPYNPDEVFCNPHCLRWASYPMYFNNKHPKPRLEWLAPPIATLKWNVDASLYPLESKSSNGGVHRDHNGQFICIFSSPIPYIDINHAEVLAIHRAIKFFMAHDNLRLHPLIDESDSTNTVKWPLESQLHYQLHS